MKTPFLAGLALASLGAQAQWLPPAAKTLNPLLVTAARGIEPAATLREATVITREELEAAGPLTLAEVLQRRAGVEIRATGGPGQPVGVFLRGAGSAQTLVLVDGLRVGSATVGTTSLENFPLEMIERIEVVKGPLSSLYGSDAIGGVIQVFTRGKAVPHFFANAGFGTDNDVRAAAGVTGTDKDTSFSVSLGHRRVEAPSASNARGFCHDPDRDPHENTFVDAKASHRLWQGETIAFHAFATRGETHFDGCASDFFTPRDGLNVQQVFGAGITSTSEFLPWWTSRLALGHGRDEIETTGSFPGRFETRHDQASWTHEFRQGAERKSLLGIEILRQSVLPGRSLAADGSEQGFSTVRREIKSAFAGVTENRAGQRFEASLRRDQDDQFGRRDTGSTSYGLLLPGWGELAATYGRGFRAPTFFDLYGPRAESGGFVFYKPNPLLRPERSTSREITWRLPALGPAQVRVTGFDNAIEDLVTYDAATATQLNIRRARIQGIEAHASATWLGATWRAGFTAQRPRDEDTGARLSGRAARFGTFEATRDFGPWRVGLAVTATGDRFDGNEEARATRLPGHALVDARIRYAAGKRWSVEAGARNLLDKRHESAIGFDAPRRGLFVGVRFEAF